MDNLRLLKKIKEKKELSGLDDSLIILEIEKYLKKNRINRDKFSEKDLLLISKDIRAQLRRYSGRFQATIQERISLLEKNNIQEILNSHISTKERIEFYPQIKNIINFLKIKSILDLGCGLNPIALADKEIFYYASDINKDDLQLVKLYFEKKKISGEIFIQDIRLLDKNLPSADLCILFKVLDIIESRGHKLAEEVIKKLDCKYLLISFPTKTLSGKPMNHPQRGWIERMLTRLEYNFKFFKSKNEIFYLVSKHSIPEIPLLQ